MPNNKEQICNMKQNDHIINLIEHLLALELLRADLNQAQIAKHLGVAKAKVNKMLKGIKLAK